MPTRRRCARRPEPEATKRRGTTEWHFGNRRADGGQVFGGYAVQVASTQRLDPGATAGVAGRPHQLGKLGGVVPAAAASVARAATRASSLEGATPRMTAAAIAGRGAGPTPARRRQLGTKGESRALAKAIRSSIPLTCAWVHLRKYGPDLVVAMGIHGWGSRGRRFKSGRPDAGQRLVPIFAYRPFGFDGNAAVPIRDLSAGRNQVWTQPSGRASGHRHGDLDVGVPMSRPGRAASLRGAA
jgi:hypothetical protein